MMNRVSSTASALDKMVGAILNPYEVRFVRSGNELDAALRLRYDIFVKECGARLQVQTPGIDRDYFDQYCAHLIAVDTTHGDVVGTYRMLTPDGRRRAGRFYMDELFETGSLRIPSDNIAEIGRACIHPSARSTRVLMLMWAELAGYLRRNGIDYVIGSASIPTTHGVEMAMQLYETMSVGRKSLPRLRVEPKVAASTVRTNRTGTFVPISLPPLIRGYFQMGAQICGEPAYDEDFDCIDIPLLFDLSGAHSRLAKRVMGSSSEFTRALSPA